MGFVDLLGADPAASYRIKQVLCLTLVRASRYAHKSFCQRDDGNGLENTHKEPQVYGKNMTGLLTCVFVFLLYSCQILGFPLESP